MQVKLKTIKYFIPLPGLNTTRVSDISDDVSSNVILFADDTKLYSRVERQEDCHTLQEDINKLVNWSEKWLMRFNTEKCKVLHFGHNSIIL